MAEWILRMRPEKQSRGGGVRYYLKNPAGGGEMGTAWTYPGAIEGVVKSEVVPDGTPLRVEKYSKPGKPDTVNYVQFKGTPLADRNPDAPNRVMRAKIRAAIDQRRAEAGKPPKYGSTATKKDIGVPPGGLYGPMRQKFRI
jgi:hypothetical protein